MVHAVLMVDVYPLMMEQLNVNVNRVIRGQLVKLVTHAQHIHVRMENVLYKEIALFVSVQAVIRVSSVRVSRRM